MSLNESHPTAVQLIGRLREGQKLLDQQPQAFVNEEPNAWESGRFGNALAHWENLGKVLRGTPFKGCIWNANTPSCNRDSVVVCDACVKRGQDEYQTALPASQ